MIKILLVLSFGLFFNLLGCSSGLSPVPSPLKPKGIEQRIDEGEKFFYQGLEFIDI